MSSLAILQSLRESIQGQATVKTIYGEPIEAQGKTIIPVARIVFGFGAGAGTGGDKDSTARVEGGGGGGGARAIPVGVVEVSAQNARFVPIADRKRLSVPVALAALYVGRATETALKRSPVWDRYLALLAENRLRTAELAR